MNDEHISKDTVKSTISASTGGQLIAGNFQIDFPPGAFIDENSVSGKRVKDIPPIVTEAMEAEGMNPTDFMLFGDVYDVKLGDKSLLGPCWIKMSCNPVNLLGNSTLGDIKVVQYKDGEWRVVRTFFSQASQAIYAETDDFSLLSTMIIQTSKRVLLPLIIGAGGSLLFLYKRRRALGDPEYLEPEKMNTSGFRIDVWSRRIEIDGKQFKMINRGSWVYPKRASEMLAEETPKGMCIDYANLFGSMLIAKGYPVRLVPGMATQKRTKLVDGMKEEFSERDGHLWVETVIDGRPYYVDYDKPTVTLVPLEEAYDRFNLSEGGHSHWKEKKDGKYESFRPDKEHNRDWWKDYVEVILIIDKSKTTIFIEEGETERGVTFVAHVIPGPAMRQDGLYYSEWDFDDGKPIVRKDFDLGKTLTAARSYTDLNDGDVLEVRVRIMNEEKATIAHESIMIKVVLFERDASEDIWNRIEKAKERLETEEKALRNEWEVLQRKRNEIGKDTPEIREANYRITSQSELIRESQRIFYDIDNEHKVWGRDKRWKSTLEIVELVLGRWSTGIMKEISQEMDKVDSSTSKWMRRRELERALDMRNKWESVFEFTRMLFLD